MDAVYTQPYKHNDRQADTATMSNKVAPQKTNWCSTRFLLLVLIAALDSADKALLAASFPILERTLHLDIAALGSFSLYTNLSYALSLPFWGWLVHRYTIHKAHVILAASCLAWGFATLGIGSSSTGSSSSSMSGLFWRQALFRSVNGAALASILPLTQTMLVELVPKASQLGKAFGIMGFAEKAAATVAVASVIWLDDDNWRRPYIAVGVASVGMAFAAYRRLQIVSSTTRTHDDVDNGGKDKKIMGLLPIIRRIIRIPEFLCLIGQGIVGAVPWDMMSFLLLLFEWKGFTKDQIVAIQFTTGISGTFGVALGGVLGDWFVQRHCVGRIGVAFVSVIGGAVLFGLLLFSNSYAWSLLWSNVFHLWGSWTPAAANRPLCAQLARNSSERAQIVAVWILMEKTAAATLGAPLVGYLTKRMLQEGKHGNGDDSPSSQSDKAAALAWNMFWLSSFFWAACAVFWLIMAYIVWSNSSTQRRHVDSGSTHREVV